MSRSDHHEPGPPPSSRSTVFFDEPSVDLLLRALASLTMELSVTRERADRLEIYLAAHHGISLSDLAAMPLDATAQAEQSVARMQLINQVLGPVAEGLARR